MNKAKRVKQGSVIALLAILVIASRLSSRVQAQELSGEISLSGAFALYPMAVKWAEEFRKQHPKVRIDISGGGAGKGMTDALAKVVDLGMVSREIHDEEVKRGVVAFGVVKDAVVPTVNTANPLFNELRKTGLKKSVAARLWNDEIKIWGDVLGTNSHVPVHVYTRSDACGAAETWAAWFGKRQEDLSSTGVFGDPGIASAIQRDKVGIGMNNIAYVYDQKTKKPYDGLAVIPLDINNNGKIDPEEDFYGDINTLMKAISDGKFPSPPARNLYLVSNGQPSSEVVKAFLRYILTDGQKYVTEVGYISVSEETIQEQLKWLGANN
ncbi:MAG: substrate-binding domain-containing protein [Tannerellaceae bacterium]|nr:substrate-binding domain-containing protein [Tannerellaceae bacterium]MCD8264160.1 substrate-binding domain-containing protein [Tannerellaceae bacterium]